MKRRVIDHAPFDPPPGQAHPKGPNGKNLCRWCGTEVSGRRISWCSDACVEEYMIRKSPGFARSQVRKRDKGVCSACGVDTYRLRRAFRSLRCVSPSYACPGCLACVVKRLWRDLTVWDADHIVPVEHGGGCCGLENYQTLCRRCHKRKTKLQAKLRASNRTR